MFFFSVEIDQILLLFPSSFLVNDFLDGAAPSNRFLYGFISLSADRHHLQSKFIIIIIDDEFLLIMWV